ncbi:MAG: hypothetical protein J6D37_04490 [Clostridia bacterium]|nr:hypothetical protein [Clostridia bacterium]
MRICFVNEGKLYSLAEKLKGEKFDLLLLSPIGRVNYQSEIEGRSGRLKSVATLSGMLSAPIFVGCETEAGGFLRKSVAVADRGKLVGISDMTHAIDRAYSAGASLKLYQTAVGKAGVLVGEDLFFPETAKLLADSGADFLVCILDHIHGDREITLLRATSFFFGLPVFSVCEGYSLAVTEGTLSFATPQSPAFYRAESKREYHLVETRRRGFFGT